MEVQKSVIRALPPDVVAQIKSSTVITRLTCVVSELVKNSLDAGSYAISLTVDFQKGSCTVEDDGCGIPPEEFELGGGLGRLHYTSKFNCENAVYGRKGAFLASLASMALLTITSRHSTSQHACSLVLHRSKVVARSIPAPCRHDLNNSGHGTRVAVTDLFGNMPVRVKHRALMLQRQEDLDREWIELEKTVTELLLAFQKPIKLIIFDSQGSRKLFIRGHTSPSPPLQLKDRVSHGSTHELNHILAILSQVGYISPKDFGSWVVASARASGISVRAAISVQPSPTKQVQFLSFGIHPLHFTHAGVLYNEINEIFSLSSFGSEEHALENEEESDETPGEPGDKRRMRGKRVNRWPMFVVRIDFKHSTTDVNKEALGSEDSLQKVLDVLRAMFHQFLGQYQFSRPGLKSEPKRGRNSSRPSSTADEQPLRRPLSCLPTFQESTNQPSGSLSQKQATAGYLGSRSQVPAAWPKSDNEGFRRLDFGSWSRVKSGHRDCWDDICSGLPRGKVAQERSGNGESQAHMRHSEFPVSASTPAAQTEDSCEITTEDAAPYGTHQHEGEAASADDIIYWTNPMTKTTVRVNKRTGQPLPKMESQTSFSTSVSRRITSSSERKSVTQSDMPPEPSGASTWLDTLLNEWVNPVFPQTECPLPSATREFLGKLPSVCGPRYDSNLPCSEEFFEQGFNPSSTTFGGRFTKHALLDCQVLSQVDNKFLLVKMASTMDNHDLADILVLVDQHAADERCRVEQLFAELCGSFSSDTDRCISLTEPIVFRVTSQEAQLFETRSRYFASWGCVYTVLEDGKRRPTVKLTKLPTLIAERCRLEPRLAIDMLRAEVWGQHDNDKRLSLPSPGPPDEGSTGPVESSQPINMAWLRHIGNCPKGIVELLNSRACRTAIMFNDPLSHEECKNLIYRLAQCAFPFQCAHGRPTMVPIVSLPSPESRNPTSAFTSVDSDLDGSSSADASFPADFIGAFETWTSRMADD